MQPLLGGIDDDEFAGGGESIEDPLKSLAAGDGGENDFCAAEFFEFGRGILRGGVDVEVRAKLRGERSLVCSAGDGDGAEAAFDRVLNGEVAESTGYFREALNEILAGGRQVF